MTIYIGRDQLEIRQRTSVVCFTTISCKEITTFLTKMVVMVYGLEPPEQLLTNRSQMVVDLRPTLPGSLTEGHKLAYFL